MKHTIRTVSGADADAASCLVQRSFLELAAGDWEPGARETFLAESSPTALVKALQAPAFAAGAFSDQSMVGFILMRRPSVLDMLFVHRDALRRGIARQLWEEARMVIEASFPAVKTVELNATPFSMPFYRAAGFAPISAEFSHGGCRATRMACWLPARSLGAVL